MTPRPVVFLALCAAGWLAAASFSRASDPPGRRGADCPTVGPGGHLSLSPDGRVMVAVTAGDQPVSLKSISQVWLSPTEAGPSGTGPTLRAFLDSGQVVTGAFRSLDDRVIRLGASLRIPRPAVRSLRQPDGRQPVLRDQTEQDVSAWKRTGSVEFRGESVPDVARIMLDPGASAERSLDLVRLGVRDRFRLAFVVVEPENARAAWTVELRFAGDDDVKSIRKVRITASPGQPVELEITPRVPGLSDPQPLRRPSQGSLRYPVELEAGRNEFSLSVRGRALAYSRTHGVSGPLTAMSVRSGPGEKTAGRVEMEGLTLFRPVSRPDPTPVDPTRDEVWFEDGSELVGRILRADADSVEIQLPVGSRRFLWCAPRGAARGVWFARPQGPGYITYGEHVRVWFETDDLIDVLEGKITAVDDASLTLNHPDLGNVSVPRGTLRRLRHEFDGRRSVIERGEWHLGPPRTFAAELSTEPAQGPSVRRTFTADATNRTATVRFEVGRSGGRELRVTVNDRLVQAVSFPERLAPPGWQTVSVPVPPSALRLGENALQFDLIADGPGHAVVRRVVLEMPN